MIRDDKQLGVPLTLFKGTTEELNNINAIEGMQAYDTTLDKLVYYDGSAWVESAEQIHTHVEADITDLDHNAVKIDGIDVDLTGIVDGQVLKYNLATTTIIAGEGYTSGGTLPGVEIDAGSFATDTAEIDGGSFV